MKNELIFCMVVVLLVIPACSQEADVYPILLPALTQTPVPSATATATPLAPTPTFTIDPSISTATMTLTPYPELELSERLMLSKDLFTNNSGCDRLPCWWGAIPGESSWVEVKNFLSAFAKVLEQKTRGGLFYTKVSIQVPREIYDGDYDIDGSVGNYYFSKDGIVEAIQIFTPLVNSYNLQTILSEYGAPSEVIVYTNLPVPNGGPFSQFDLILVYEDMGILADYFVPGEKIDGGVRGCFENEKPGLIVVWNPEQGWNLEDITKMMVGISLPYKYSISEVTDYTPEGFYRAFNGITGWKCILIENDYLQRPR